MTIYMLARNLVANRAEGFFLLIFLHQHVYERLEVKENLCSLLVSVLHINMSVGRLEVKGTENVLYV